MMTIPSTFEIPARKGVAYRSPSNKSRAAITVTAPGFFAAAVVASACCALSVRSVDRADCVVCARCLRMPSRMMGT